MKLILVSRSKQSVSAKLHELNLTTNFFKLKLAFKWISICKQWQSRLKRTLRPTLKCCCEIWVNDWNTCTCCNSVFGRSERSIEEMLKINQSKSETQMCLSLQLSFCSLNISQTLQSKIYFFTQMFLSLHLSFFLLLRYFSTFLLWTNHWNILYSSITYISSIIFGFFDIFAYISIL